MSVKNTKQSTMVKEWNDRHDCRMRETELHAVSRQLVDATHHKYGGSKDSAESERVEDGFH